MKSNKINRLLFSTFVIFITFQPLYSQEDNKLKSKVISRLEKWQNPLLQWQHITKPTIDSVSVVNESETITLYFAPGLSYYPFREDSYNLFMESFRKPLGKKFRDYTIDVITNSYSIDQLIPNYYRQELRVDSARFPVLKKDKKIAVRTNVGTYPSRGLYGNSIALWHSHGYYFEMTLDRWEWQRAKLFSTVEDISVMGYVVPYLTKMLENAGASVWLPRERDIQTSEVIVDNDRSTGDSEFIMAPDSSFEKIDKGFLLTDTLYPGYNPFKHGTSLRKTGDSAVYLPEIPERGYYAVYISYPLLKDNNTGVSYTVKHTGGNTEFIVDQTIGGETWVYLGTFHFNAGKNTVTGSVTVKGNDSNNDLLALDAVRFGGGMGNVARQPSAEIIRNQQSRNENISEAVEGNTTDTLDFSWKLSGKPRFLEAARYWLQYAGMPDTLVYTPNNYKNDYNDDYQSRGLWVNYLKGDPFEPDTEDQPGGLGLDLDMSFAFHTDAGITPGDSIIGTLAICYTSADSGKFSDSTSRMASRDLADIIQTQIVADIRKDYNPDWTRRGLWDRPYSEARRPDVPGMLLELLSHQNLADMRYNLDPRFRFSVCRSVYKGILKYLSYIENREYVVQPLPVKGFAVTPVSGKTIRLSWEPVTEPDEPTSKPDRYKIYTRRGDNGFDNGFVVENTSVEIELPSYDSIYSFKVTALNDGGESFDSEMLSAGVKTENAGSVLVVNGFDRISGPAWFDKEDMAGMAWWDDRGVPYICDIITIGDQYDYNRQNPWLDDDSPGWGASYTDMEGKVIPGNSFDYAYVHGKAIMAAGHSFFSVSDEYFTSDGTDVSLFRIIDLIFGEEKSTPFFNDTLRTDFRIYTPEFMDRIRLVTQAGASIFMSGAYVGSDQFSPGDSAVIEFAKQTLHFLPRTGHAVKSGEVYATDYIKPELTGKYTFNTLYSPLIYQVEAPDAIEPAGKGAVCSFRYAENNASAGVAFKGDYNTLILGFPFETILSEKQRELLMKQILDFLKR